MCERRSLPSPSSNTNIFFSINYLCVRIFQWSLFGVVAMWMQCACAVCCLQTNKLCVFRIIYIVHSLALSWKISKRAALMTIERLRRPLVDVGAIKRTLGALNGIAGEYEFTAYQWVLHTNYTAYMFCILCLDGERMTKNKIKNKISILQTSMCFIYVRKF